MKQIDMKKAKSGEKAKLKGTVHRILRWVKTKLK